MDKGTEMESAKSRIFQELDEKLGGISPEVLKEYLVSRGIAEYCD